MKKHQSGIVLILSLIILLVLTILVISVMTFSSNSETLTANQRDKAISFQAAEAALVEGEMWIKAQNSPPKSESSCKTNACDVFVLNTFTSYQTQPVSWWNTYGRPYSGKITQAKTQPRYIVEEYSFIPYDLSPQTSAKKQGYYYYQITAQGTGVTDNAKSVVQSIYSTQYN